eukprot:5427684-Prymnesium_polylepis.1
MRTHLAKDPVGHVGLERLLDLERDLRGRRGWEELPRTVAPTFKVAARGGSVRRASAAGFSAARVTAGRFSAGGSVWRASAAGCCAARVSAG